MKRTIYLFILAILPLNLIFGQYQNQRYIDYINRYKNLAIKEQAKYGIPAYITLAQALVESNAGHSMLAVKAKNHFGIKCGSNWNGRTINKDDDNIADCFRSYRSVAESYEDHSLFLKRQRYQSLYSIPTDDYKAWAKELKRLGYATDRQYDTKLIKIIEDYNLDAIKYEEISYNRPTIYDNAKVYDTNALLIPTDNNGIRCYILQKDATIREIAQVLRKRNTKMLLYYNDMFEDGWLKAGTYVYTSKKRAKADEKYRSHYVLGGESMHTISQKYGITLKAIYKINNLKYGTPAKEGMVLFLQR